MHLGRQPDEPSGFSGGRTTDSKCSKFLYQFCDSLGFIWQQPLTVVKQTQKWTTFFEIFIFKLNIDSCNCGLLGYHLPRDYTYMFILK